MIMLLVRAPYFFKFITKIMTFKLFQDALL